MSGGQLSGFSLVHGFACSHTHTHTQRNYSARAQAHKYTPVAINTREAKKKSGRRDKARRERQKGRRGR